MNTKQNSRVLSATISTILAAVSPALCAQDAVLDTVTVTATRRTESLQEVPLNIAAVSGSQIEEQGIGNLVDVSRTVPGLFVLDQGGRAANAIIVRGLNADPIQGTEALGNDGGGTKTELVGMSSSGCRSRSSK